MVAEDVVGDELLVDGGMVRFEVIEKIGPDVKCRCTDPGLLLPRTNLTFWRDGNLVCERNAMLPTISSKDWLDIDFGIAEGVGFIAISFAKSAEVIKHLKSYIKARAPDSLTKEKHHLAIVGGCSFRSMAHAKKTSIWKWNLTDSSSSYLYFLYDNNSNMLYLITRRNVLQSSISKD